MSNGPMSQEQFDQCLDALEAFICINRYPPTVAELAKIIGRRKTWTRELLLAMSYQGLIVKSKGSYRAQRSWVPARFGGRGKCPHCGEPLPRSRAAEAVREVMEPEPCIGE